MTKKPNRYEQYAKLSEAKVKGKGKNNIENIVPLCAYLSGSTISLEIVPKYEHGSPRTPISLQAFCKFPNLCNALSKALLKHHKNSTYRTIESMVGNLKAGFLTYLEEIDKTDISVSEIDQALLNSFKAWLNQASTGDFNEAKWAVNTRMKRHGAIWLVIKQLEKIPEGIDLQELRRPKNQWPSAHKKSKPVEGFSQENLEKAYSACFREVEKIVHDFYETKELVKKHRPNILNIPYRREKNVYRDFGNAISAVDYYYPDHVFPVAEEFIKRCGQSLHRCLPPLYGGVFPRFIPTTRSIIPFMLLLSTHYSANTTTMLTTSISDFEWFDVLGTKRIRWKGEKNRSSTDPVRSHVISDEIDNPAFLVNFLIEYTAPLRKVVPVHLKDRLFLFITQGAGNKASSYFASGGRGGQDSAWVWPFSKFIKENNLEKFTLQELRQTVLDRVDDIYNGDIRARKTAAQHSSINTTHTHYTSAAVKRQNHERIALGINQRHRHLESGGKIDHRLSIDGKSSATPGFDCLDPFDSPLPDQRKGRLCTAYGRCPGCPIATTNSINPRSCAQIAQLRITISDAKVQISPRRFLEVWAPIIKKIDKVWMPSFKDSVQAEARDITLPKLPPIE